jgi:hypothetical protein
LGTRTGGEKFFSKAMKYGRKNLKKNPKTDKKTREIEKNIWRRRNGV